MLNLKSIGTPLVLALAALFASGCDQADQTARQMLDQAAKSAKQTIDQAHAAANQALDEAHPGAKKHVTADESAREI